MKTGLDYFFCLQDKARDRRNLHVTLIFGKDTCRNERVGWLDGPDSADQTRAWIEELVEAGYKPIGFEVIKKDPEVFEQLDSDWLDFQAKQLLDDYQKSRACKED